MAERPRATYLPGGSDPLAEGNAEAKSAFAVTAQVHNVFLRRPAKMAVPSRASRTPRGRRARTRRRAPGATERRDVIAMRRQFDVTGKPGCPEELSGSGAALLQGIPETRAAAYSVCKL